MSGVINIKKKPRYFATRKYESKKCMILRIGRELVSWRLISFRTPGGAMEPAVNTTDTSHIIMKIVFRRCNSRIQRRIIV